MQILTTRIHWFLETTKKNKERKMQRRGEVFYVGQLSSHSTDGLQGLCWHNQSAEVKLAPTQHRLLTCPTAYITFTINNSLGWYKKLLLRVHAVHMCCVYARVCACAAEPHMSTHITQWQKLLAKATPAVVKIKILLLRVEYTGERGPCLRVCVSTWNTKSVRKCVSFYFRKAAYCLDVGVKTSC